MIAVLLELRSERVRLFHVRMAFSEDMESVGKFALRKVWVLFTTILRIWRNMWDNSMDLAVQARRYMGEEMAKAIAAKG